MAQQGAQKYSVNTSPLLVISVCSSLPHQSPNTDSLRRKSVADMRASLYLMGTLCGGHFKILSLEAVTTGELHSGSPH